MQKLPERGFSLSRLVPIRPKKSQFGALSKTHFSLMISFWNCVKCDQVPRQKWEAPEMSHFVLKCGHYLCSQCMAEEDAVSPYFYCPRVIPSEGDVHSTCGVMTDLSVVPPYASHIADMHWMLSEKGLPCHFCKDQYGQTNFYPSDLILVCKNCTKMNKDTGKWADAKIFEDPAVIPDQDPYSYTLLCLYCSRAAEPIHGNHLVWSLGQHAMFTQLTLRKEYKMISIRAKWNLAMLSRDMMIRLLSSYLVCECGHEYSNQKPDIKPVMLGCNHIVCSACVEPDWIDRLCKVEPRCPICKARAVWKSKPLCDLEFAATRNKDEYANCEVCKKLFPADRRRLCAKQFKNKENGEIKECPNTICFDCIRTPASRKHHFKAFKVVKRWT